MRVEEPVAPGSLDTEAVGVTDAEERVSVAPQWQLMWWRFRKHKLALLSTALVLLFYLVVVFADFLAYSDPHASEAQRSLIAPQTVHLFDDGRFSPYVEGLVGQLGSLNPLSHTSQTGEVMARLVSRDLAQQMAAFVAIKPSRVTETYVNLAMVKENPPCASTRNSRVPALT